MAFHKLWDHKFELAPGKWVFIPSDESKEQGKQIVSELKRKWRPPLYYHHCHRGGHIQAIKKHLGHHFFFHIDIENFYISINRSRVTRVLKKYFNYEIAREYARNSTVRLTLDTHSRIILPFGFIQSSFIASLCLKQSALGSRLHQLSFSPNFKVSVYVDDIIVSSNNLHLLEQEYLNVLLACRRSKWQINTNKTSAPSQKISVFNIDLSYQKLIISKKRMTQFSKAFSESTSVAQKNGIFNYIYSINPAQVKLLR